MRIGIIAAMDKELELLLHGMDNVKEYSYDGTTYFEGHIGQHEVVAGKCGIGKVNSAIGACKFIKGEHPDLIINSGVAGSGDVSMSIGDILFADSFAYHDVWCGPGTVYGAADGLPPVVDIDERMLRHAREVLDDSVKYGLICSGDKFMTTAEELAFVKSHFPDCLAVDMESASIGQVCRMNDVPFIIVRAVSDRPGSGDNISEYQNFWTEAPEHIVSTVRKFIETLE